jgi:hypothetical protein
MTVRVQLQRFQLIILLIVVGITLAAALSDSRGLLAVLTGLATLFALLTVFVAAATSQEAIRAQADLKIERTARELERTAERLDELLPAAVAGDVIRWQSARVRLRIPLALLGDAELPACREVVGLEPDPVNALGAVDLCELGYLEIANALEAVGQLRLGVLEQPANPWRLTPAPAITDRDSLPTRPRLR